MTMRFVHCSPEYSIEISFVTIAECKLESEYVRTFDNVTYKYPLGECWHLLAKDCSKEAPVAVLAKESSSTGKVGHRISADFHSSTHCVKFTGTWHVHLIHVTGD